MKVLVLGGCGFIGSHIVDALLDAGHSVRVVSRHPEPFRKPLVQVDYRYHDFTCNGEMEKALDDIDAVIHAISTVVPATSNNNPVADIESNLIGSVNLLDRMRKKGIERILYLSSGGVVYGSPEQLPVLETYTTNPLCSYGVVKLAVEGYLNMYQNLYGLKPIIIRASNPYGIRQGGGIQGVIPTFLSAIFNEKNINIWGDGSIIRDYIDVRDLASLCCLAIEGQVTGTFNAGSGQGRSINEIIEIIFEVTGKTIPVNYQQGRDFDVKEIVLDIQKAKSTFSWKPAHSLNQGVADYWQWLGETKKVSS